MSDFIPHIHTCEVKMCHPINWSTFYPLQESLSESADECEDCKHFVIVEFAEKECLSINNVVHVNVM